MKRKMFLLGSLALIVACSIFWSCQKDELMNPEEVMLKKAIKIASTDDLTWDAPVCAGVEHEFCLTFPQAYASDKTKETNGNLQFRIDDAWVDVIPDGTKGDTEICADYTFASAGTYRARFKASGTWQEVNVVVIECDCETAFTGETECGEFEYPAESQNYYNRKAVYTFSTEDEGDFKIQGGLTNFTGEEYDVVASVGDVSTRIPGSSSNRIITVEGELDDCGEVVVTVYWNSTNTATYITGDWSVELDGVKILVIDKLECNDEGEGYEPTSDDDE